MFYILVEIVYNDSSNNSILTGNHNLTHYPDNPHKDVINLHSFVIFPIFMIFCTVLIQKIKKTLHFFYTSLSMGSLLASCIEVFETKQKLWLCPLWHWLQYYEVARNGYQKWTCLYLLNFKAAAYKALPNCAWKSTQCVKRNKQNPASPFPAATPPLPSTRSCSLETHWKASQSKGFTWLYLFSIIFHSV